MRESAKKPWLARTPNASVIESSQVYVSVNVVSDEVEEVTEVIETTEATEVIVGAGTTETEEDGTEEEVDVSMTDEEATAIRAHLLRGLATTDTEALLQRAELTATSQAAHTETILPPAGAARPPTIAHAAVPPPLHPGAAAATPQASPAHARRRLVRPADAATTGQHREMSLTAKTRAKAKANVVTKAADPVRVLLLTSVAHDHPDATASPTTPAAEGRLRTIADPLLPRNATAELRHQYLVHHLAGAAMPQHQGHPHVRLPDAATSAMTKSSCRDLTGATSVGLAQVMQAAAGVAAAVAVVTNHHHQRSAKRWTQGNSHTWSQKVIDDRFQGSSAPCKVDYRTLQRVLISLREVSHWPTW